MSKPDRQLKKSKRVHGHSNLPIKAIITLMGLTPLGASNPYALAQVIALQKGDTIDWSDHKPKDAKSLLKRYLGVSYSDLFDPSTSTILYSDMLPKLVVMISNPDRDFLPPYLEYRIDPIREKVINDLLMESRMDTAGPSSEKNTVDTGKFTTSSLSDMLTVQNAKKGGIRSATIPLGAPMQTRMMVYDGGEGHAPDADTAVPTIWKDVPNLYYTKVSGGANAYQDNQDDIIQGALPDCYFLAALAAWRWFTKTPVTTQAAGSSYSVPLFDGSGNAITITVSSELPLLTSSSTHPVYADLTPQNEVYPAIYEKAYAVLRGCGNSSIPSNSGQTNPDLASLGRGDALAALQTIANLKYGFGPIPPANIPTEYYTVSPANCPGTGLDDATNLNNFTSQFDSMGKVLHPMMAWTYFTGGQYSPPPNSGRPAAPANVQYVSDWMVANHAYAVLGLKTLGGFKYIILRNPYGPTWGGVPSMAGYPYNDPDGIWNKTPYNWKPLATNNYTINISQTTNAGKTKPDGIFALKLTHFLTYFEAVGWGV